MIISLTTFIFFQLYGLFLERSTYLYPKSCEAKLKTRWVNIFMSMTHSAISSAGCVYCYVTNNHLFTDIINQHTSFTLKVVAFSWGYFIHDLVHTLCNRKISRSWDILLHHVVVVACFGIAMVQHRYVNFACTSLFCEINSVTLHMRQLNKMAEYATCNSTPWWKQQQTVVKGLNFLTYVLFRISTLAYMTWWLWKSRNEVGDIILLAGAAGLLIMNCINLVLFKRLFVADVFATTTSTSSKTKKQD